MAETAPEPRTLLFAYSELGARCLEWLLERGQRVVGVYTHEDDPAEPRWFRSVAQIAERSGIPVARPERLRDAAVIESVRALAPELIFSFYYRSLIPREILALPRLGAFNMHGSLLPRYRGRAPVNWAVLHGEKETGVTLHHMVERADAGDIVDQEPVPIGPEDTAAQVMERIVEAAVRVLERRLGELVQGRAPRTPQDEERATTFGRRRPQDGRIDWNAAASQIANLVRAVTRPFPGAFTEFGEQRLQLWRARALPLRGAAGQVLAHTPLVVAAGSGALEIAEWSWDPQPAGATPAAPPPIGAQLGQLELQSSEPGRAAAAPSRR
jgi:methionyl-tRNA formyltransferase